MGKGQTWHDDLGEAQLPGHHGGPVHQVGVVLADLNDVPHEHLHGHPEAWKGRVTMKSQFLQGVLSVSPPLPHQLSLGLLLKENTGSKHLEADISNQASLGLNPTGYF